MFCKSCEPEPEIVFVLIFVTKTISGSDSGSQLVTKRVNQHCHALEIMKKISVCLIFIYITERIQKNF